MYDRITNIPTESNNFSSEELKALSHVWSERREGLARSGAYQEFLKRLQREWAIETGIIERLYTWDRGVTEMLIEHGIEAALIAHRGGLTRETAEHVKELIDDQLGIIEGLFSFVKGDTPLTEHFIRGMQAQFTAHQESTEAVTPDNRVIRVPIQRGEYKNLPNNPRRPDGTTHEYCPPELVKEEMEKLLTWYREAEGKCSPEILSAWLDHRFTCIHPFQDGNGRVARALASLVFLKSGLFPLVIRDAERVEYIGALEVADAGDLKSLVQLFAKRERDEILAALGIEQQVQQSRHAEQIITSAIQMLKDRFQVEVKRKGEIYATADKLRELAIKRITEISVLLDPQLRAVTPHGHATYRATVRNATNTSPDRGYFYNQIIEVAKTIKYFVNLDKYRAWIRLSIVTDNTFEFVLSIHGYGHGDTGIMAASAFTAFRVPREDGDGTDTANTCPASPDLFQFNYAEPAASTEARFKEWLEATVAIALAEWRRRLPS